MANLRQLTRGGANTQARWSFDGDRLAFTHQGRFTGHPETTNHACGQVYSLRLDGEVARMLSNGQGKAASPSFLSRGDRAVFSSTFATAESCPPKPDPSLGEVWSIPSSFLTYTVKADGTDLLQLEPGQPRAYNAEAATCGDGSVVFTSDRDGDLELYVGKVDPWGTLAGTRRITRATGYDGSAAFSPDCSKIAWSASRPRPGTETDGYRRLLKRHLFRPTELEIWVADVDGARAKQVTRLEAVSFAPTFTPDGRSLLFSSNARHRGGKTFEIYLVDLDGKHLEQVTRSGGFDGFPMFSPDGKTLAFSSRRNSTDPHEINVFVAKWRENPQAAGK